MSLRTFLRTYREEIDRRIREALPSATVFNEKERRCWVMADKGLNAWARSLGVKL